MAADAAALGVELCSLDELFARSDVVTLHTPLMAATNAISAISLVASLVIAGAERPFYINVMGAVAVAAATINVVGGFVITDRMLKMFKKTEAPK